MTKPLLRLEVEIDDPLCEVCTLPVRVLAEAWVTCAVCGIMHKDCKCEHRLEN